jgi:exosome complex component RRP43
MACAPTALPVHRSPWSPSANLVPLSSLCIEPGKAVYVLYLDLVCINYDGNVVDAALLAINATLRNCAHRPIVARMDAESHRAQAFYRAPSGTKMNRPR